MISKHSLIKDLATDLNQIQIEEIQFLANVWDPTGKKIIDIQDLQEYLKIYTKQKKVRIQSLLLL